MLHGVPADQVLCAWQSKSESFYVFWRLASRTLLAMVLNKKWIVLGNSNSMVSNYKAFSPNRKSTGRSLTISFCQFLILKAFLFIHSLNKMCQGEVLTPQSTQATQLNAMVCAE